jgi:L-amino acid N-acyltransferase YncA
MPGGFQPKLFSDVNLGDPFFDSLKADYEEFTDWFAAKSAAGERAYAVENGDGTTAAFLYLKDETGEAIELEDGTLPAAPRLKIGTLKVSDDARGTRLGEGAIGLALWRWRNTGFDEVYVTAFEKHEALVGILKRFGFNSVGTNARGESVFVKDRRSMDCSDPYRCFPFLTDDFTAASLLVVNDHYHDELFPYSDLANEFQESFRSAAANGVTKIYVGSAWKLASSPGRPVLIYRRYTGGDGAPRYKSVVTSYCMVTDVVWFKKSDRELQSFEQFRTYVKNKSVFTDEELAQRWGEKHVVVVEMVYLGYFGAGHNVNMAWLDENGLWPTDYPAQYVYTKDQFLTILEAGGVCREDALVD